MDEIEVSIFNGQDTRPKSNDSFGVDVTKFLDMYGSQLDGNLKRRIKYRATSTTNQKGIDGAASKSLESELRAYDILEAVVPPYNLDYLAELYEKSSWNYAAINAKTANVCGLGYELAPTRAIEEKISDLDSEEKIKKARNKLSRLKTYLYGWIDSLNNYDLFIQSVTNMYIDYQATGNGYLEIGRISSGKDQGSIGYVGHIPSSTMRVRRNRDGFVQMVDGQIRFFRNFGDEDTEDPLGIDPNPNEVIHFKKYSPKNTYYGVPDVVAALGAVAGNEFSSRYNLDFFEHRTAPRYLIISKGASLSTTAQTQLMEFLQSDLKGKNQRSVYIPLPPDRGDAKSEIKFEAVENGIQDSSFDNYQVSNRDEILAVHRVPLSKLGVSSASGGSVAAATDLDKTFKEIVCRPEQDILEKKINWIIEDKTDVLRIEFNELTLTDALSQSQIYERYLRLQTITPNEVRPSLGLPPIAGGDAVIDLTKNQAKQTLSTARQTRTRDAQRQLEATDSNNSSRAPKGEGETRTQ